MLQKYDGGNDKVKKEVIDYLQNNFVYAQFHHTKPADLKRKEKKVAKEYNIADHTFDGNANFLEYEPFITEMRDSNRVGEFSPMLHNQIDYSKFADFHF
jgi:hypothetical protein